MPTRKSKPSTRRAPSREQAFQAIMDGFAQDREIGAISAVSLKGAMLSEVWRAQGQIRALRKASR